MWKSILGLALALTTSTASAQPSSPFHRGVNVLGYDPYWTDESKRRFEWRHFREIHDAGFDFVRLNLQAFRHMDAQNRLEPEWIAKLDDVLREAGKAGLGVIVDERLQRMLYRHRDLPCQALRLLAAGRSAPV